MSGNREMSLISKTIAGISIVLTVLLFSALVLTACNNDNTEKIDEEKAKEIAILHAGVPADSITRYRLERDRDDGRDVYEIEFWSGNAEYDYDIDIKTGEITKFGKDIKK